MMTEKTSIKKLTKNEAETATKYTQLKQISNKHIREFCDPDHDIN